MKLYVLDFASDLICRIIGSGATAEYKNKKTGEIIKALDEYRRGLITDVEAVQIIAK